MYLSLIRQDPSELKDKPCQTWTFLSSGFVVV